MSWRYTLRSVCGAEATTDVCDHQFLQSCLKNFKQVAHNRHEFVRRDRKREKRNLLKGERERIGPLREKRDGMFLLSSCFIGALREVSRDSHPGPPLKLWLTTGWHLTFKTPLCILLPRGGHCNGMLMIKGNSGSPRPALTSSNWSSFL